MAFTAAAQRHADRVGIVHLAMHVHQGGLVAAWQQSVESIAEPGVPREVRRSGFRGWSGLGLVRVLCS